VRLLNWYPRFELAANWLDKLVGFFVKAGQTDLNQAENFFPLVLRLFRTRSFRDASQREKRKEEP
jgi:hypothetical protein